MNSGTSEGYTVPATLTPPIVIYPTFETKYGNLANYSVAEYIFSNLGN